MVVAVAACMAPVHFMLRVSHVRVLGQTSSSLLQYTPLEVESVQYKYPDIIKFVSHPVIVQHSIQVYHTHLVFS